jgi:hypothetical protein
MPCWTPRPTLARLVLAFLLSQPAKVLEAIQAYITTKLGNEVRKLCTLATAGTVVDLSCHARSCCTCDRIHA